MPVPGAPTVAKPAGGNQGGQAPAAAPVIPFTRASRKKRRLAGTYGPIIMNTAVQALPPIPLPAAGYFRWLRLEVTITSAGNSAAVAWKNDAPFSILQNIQLLSANGDSLISLIDGFTLYVLNKYGAFSSGTIDPCADPNFTTVSGSGATAGSAHFNIRVPVEIDARDAFCALQNMAANQSFQLQISINALANMYSVLPTAAPTVTLRLVMDYWSAPASKNADEIAQATAPPANGSVSLIQTQTPNINPNSFQNVPLLSVGNTVRALFLILRDAAGVRTEVDWPDVFNMYVNNDPWYYNTKNNWRADLAAQYDLFGGISATPAATKLDNGVFVVQDFMNDGSPGAGVVNGGANRNLLLVTGSATAFNIEAANWGAAASSLFIVTNSIRPRDPSAVYAPSLI